MKVLSNRWIKQLWIWDKFAISKVSWDFLNHDFPPSFVEKEPQSIQTRFSKKWSGLVVCADPSVLYQPRENSGMGLKEATIQLKKQCLIRRHQLLSSKSPRVKAAH